MLELPITPMIEPRNGVPQKARGAPIEAIYQNLANEEFLCFLWFIFFRWLFRSRLISGPLALSAFLNGVLCDFSYPVYPDYPVHPCFYLRILATLAIFARGPFSSYFFRSRLFVVHLSPNSSFFIPHSRALARLRPPWPLLENA